MQRNDPPGRNFADISPLELSDRMAAGDDWVVLDVREPQEHVIAAIAGTLNIPMGEVPARASEIDALQNIAVLCHSGLRSAKVAQYLAGRGFGSVHNISGGIDRWSVDIDPSIPRY